MQVKAPFACFKFGLFSYFLIETMFFSHNNSAEIVFSANFSQIWLVRLICSLIKILTKKAQFLENRIAKA